MWLHRSLRFSLTWRLWGQGTRQVYSRLPGRSKHWVPGGHELLARAHVSTSFSQFCPTNPKKERKIIILKSKKSTSCGGKSQRRQVNSNSAHRDNTSFVQTIEIKRWTRELVPSPDRPVLKWFLESSQFLQRFSWAVQARDMTGARTPCRHNFVFPVSTLALRITGNLSRAYVMSYKMHAGREQGAPDKTDKIDGWMNGWMEEWMEGWVQPPFNLKQHLSKGWHK